MVDFDPPTHYITKKLDAFCLKSYDAKGIKPPHEGREGFPKIIYATEHSICPISQVLATTFIVLLVTNDCGFKQW